MKIPILSWLGALLFGLLTVGNAFGTHLRAGEITTRRVSSTSLTYEITLTTYHDELGGKTASDQEGSVFICPGVGSPIEVNRREPRTLINRATSINIYRTTFTYPGPGTYNIVVTMVNRNTDVVNIPASVETSFQLRTTIVVNANLGLNSTPVLLNPPLDSARVGQKWCHNPAAFDADGDSLAYRLYTPAGRLATVANDCNPRFVAGYLRPETIGTNPITEAGNAPATLTVNPITGDVCWDAPAQVGQYNIAFIIEEWRGGVKIGEIVRDMQIIVTPSTNRRPDIQVPQDICVQAGTLINQTISATDPDNNRLAVTAYGGPFNRAVDGSPLALVANPAATLTTPAQPQAAPATATFSWQTNCSQVREEPYDVVFRVVDYPRSGTQLATLGSFRIRIYAPQPTGLSARPVADASGRAIALNWSPYGCTTPANTQMVVYRKEGCQPATFDPCATNDQLAAAGYVEVGRVPISQTTFVDNNNQQGLARGVQYSYVIVAAYPRSGLGAGGGGSAVSAQVCVNLPQQVPLLTNVTVDSTDARRGVITVRWTRPPGINPADGGAPFQYRLVRTSGLSGTAFQPLVTIPTALQAGVGDTVYVDRGLNTQDSVYRYRVEFFYTDPATNTLTQLDATEAASSVRLAAQGAVRSIALSWQANTPWSNDNQTHRIYRSTQGPNGPFNRIAEVAVQGPNTYGYTDTGADTYAGDGNTSLSLSVDSVYCYRVETVGTYAVPVAGLGLLYNFSQGLCASPIDTTRPCPPRLSIDSLICSSLTPEALCNQSSFANNLSWQPASGSGCDANVVAYRLYYAPCEGQELQLLATLNAPLTTYRHEGLTSYAGCYEVRAVNRSGAESGPSNRVCKDNCPYLAFPNVFTPNGDGKNDVFEPLSCPRFVETAELVIYNRWGAQVYQGSGLAWSGRSSGGQVLGGGLYYYQATVRFTGLSCAGPPQLFKGWVELIRQANPN